MQTHTVFGSLTDYTKGSIELVSGVARHYAFSSGRLHGGQRA